PRHRLARRRSLAVPPPRKRHRHPPMKNYYFCLFILLTAFTARADILESSFSSRTVVIPGNSYELDFAIFWTCNEFPITSTPGRVELVNAQGWVVGWAQ